MNFGHKKFNKVAKPKNKSQNKIKSKINQTRSSWKSKIQVYLFWAKCLAYIQLRNSKWKIPETVWQNV